MKTIAIILAIISLAIAQNEGLYTTLVYMVQHQIGCDGEFDCGRDELLNYLQQVFRVDNETHEQALQDARKMKTPVVQLNVGVIEAKNLDWKDSNGKSDPFCTLYIESSPTLRYNTAVKNQTLKPFWNEHFHLPMEHAENDVLCLEVWDLDPIETLSTKISQIGNIYGVRGFFKLAQELTVSGVTGNPTEEFIGSCKISVKDISLIEKKCWYVLKDEETSDPHGYVLLRLGFCIENNTQAAIQEHRYLLNTLLLHELQTLKTNEYRWWGNWSPAAGTLLHQHQARNGLLPRNVALSEWIVYSSRLETDPLDFYVFKKLAKTLTQPLVNGLFSSDDILLFWEGARKVLYSCFRNIREIGSSTNSLANTGTQLPYIAGIISSISRLNIPEDFDLFPIEMYDWLPHENSKKIDVLKMLEFTVIETGILWWNNTVLQNNTAETDSHQNAIEYRIKIIQRVMAKLERVSSYLDRIFMKKVNFPYTETLYVTFGEKLSDLCMTTVVEVCQQLQSFDVDTDNDELNLGIKLYELYQALKKFVTYGNSLGIDGQRNMNIRDYYKWIKGGVDFRLDMAINEALVRIESAIKSDDLESALNSSSAITSSAFELVKIFDQLGSFWKQMAWPDVKESFTYIETIIKNVRSCSVNYARAMSSKVESVKQEMNREDDNATIFLEEMFRVAAVANFAVNNINHMKKSIGQWAKDFHLQELIDELENDESQRDEANFLRQMLRDNVIDETICILEMEIAELLIGVNDVTALSTRKNLTADTESFVTASDSDSADFVIVHRP